MEELLTVEQAASMLGMHPASVRRAILAGRLRGQHLSPRVLVLTRAEVERYRDTEPKRGWPKGRPRQPRPAATDTDA